MILKYLKPEEVIFSLIYQKYRKIELVTKEELLVCLLKMMKSYNYRKIELATKEEVSVYLLKTMKELG